MPAIVYLKVIQTIILKKKMQAKFRIAETCKDLCCYSDKLTGNEIKRYCDMGCHEIEEVCEFRRNEGDEHKLARALHVLLELQQHNRTESNMADKE